MITNPHYQLKIEYIGLEKSPIVIVDDFLQDVTPLIDYASQFASFSNVNATMYPGVRGGLPKEYVIIALKALGRSFYEIYSIPKHLRLTPLGLNFSMVSTPKDKLSIMQRLPHYDSTKPYYFALLQYLNPMPHGGTAFFRHKESGFECITPHREGQYLEHLKAQLPALESSTKGYYLESSEHFERYYEIDYKPNRMVFYPGNLLHSGLIGHENDISEELQSGRLTANMFIDFR